MPKLDLTEIKAREILDYCIEYLGTGTLETYEYRKTKRYKEMLKEIKFLIETS